MARATLSQFIGGDPSRLAVTAGHLVELPAEQGPALLNAAANPLVVEQNAAVEQARAQLRVLERSYFPRFYLQAAAYARGSGAGTNGDRLGGLNGLAPTFQNYALGFSATFPIFDLPSLRAREASQSAAIRSQRARSEQIAVDLRAQWNRTVAPWAGRAGSLQIPRADCQLPGRLPGDRAVSIGLGTDGLPKRSVSAWAKSMMYLQLNVPAGLLRLAAVAGISTVPC